MFFLPPHYFKALPWNGYIVENPNPKSNPMISRIFSLRGLQFLLLALISFSWSCSDDDAKGSGGPEVGMVDDSPADSPFPIDSLDQLIIDSVQPLVDAGWPGGSDGMVSVGVYYTRDDEVQLFKQYFFSNGSNPLPDGNTIYQIGSVTKTYTAAMVNRLNFRGHIRITDPAQNYLPSEDGVVPKVLLPNRFNGRPASISVLDLLCHRSGLGQNLPVDTVTSSTPYLWGINLLPGENLWFNPGDSCYIYSNQAFGIAGLICSFRSYPGDPDFYDKFETVLLDSLLIPMDMRNTRIQLTPEQLARRATPNNSSGRRSTYAMGSWPFNHAGGGIKSCLIDQMKYGIEMVGNGRYFAPGEREELIAIESFKWNDTCKVDVNRFRARLAMAWERNNDLTDKAGGSNFTRFSKDGLTNGFSSFMSFTTPRIWGVPRDAFVVVLANKKGFPVGQISRQILQDVMNLAPL